MNLMESVVISTLDTGEVNGANACNALNANVWSAERDQDTSFVTD